MEGWHLTKPSTIEIKGVKGMGKRAVIYARVSTDEQAEKGYSLPHQLEECRKYAYAHNIKVVGEMVDDFSGSTLERPGFTKMASVGQFLAQAPHSMQAFRSVIWAFPCLTLKMRWGQTSSQLPQPIHFSSDNRKIAVSSRYLKPFKIILLVK